MSTKLKPTELSVFKFMRAYQHAHNGLPPTLEEIASIIPELNYRSSARYTIAGLLAKGLIELVAPVGYGRRYAAKEEV